MSKNVKINVIVDDNHVKSDQFYKNWLEEQGCGSDYYVCPECHHNWWYDDEGDVVLGNRVILVDEKDTDPRDLAWGSPGWHRKNSPKIDEIECPHCVDGEEEEYYRR